MEIIVSIAVFAALLGAYFVSEGKWYGFAIWIFTNSIFGLNCFFCQQYIMTFLFMAYLGLAINGMCNLLKKEQDDLD